MKGKGCRGIDRKIPLQPWFFERGQGIRGKEHGGGLGITGVESLLDPFSLSFEPTQTLLLQI